MSDKKHEIEFVKKYFMSDDSMINTYEMYNQSDMKYEETIDALLDYCFYSDFDPHLDDKYLDYGWLCDETTGLIYNLDDMYEVYVNDLKGE